MRYIDTNVLVRMITGDKPEVARQALAEIDGAGANEFFVHDAVLVELCFVLEYHDYAMKRADIGEALQTLLEAPQVATAKESRVALELYREHPRLDYADCLLAALGGVRGVWTFDRDLQRELLVDGA